MAQKYPKPMIIIHWLTLLLVLIAYFTGDYPPADGVVGEIHVASGMSLVLLLVLRLGMRWHYRQQLPVHHLPPLLRLSAHAVQILLYLCLLFTPIVGYLTLIADVEDFMVFGMGLPYFHFSLSLGNAHEMLANGFIALSGLHATAALFHHVVLKDHVLKSMSPH
ncbi:cytochrome b [Pasteurella sp. PK-2025]|uniref:cytochrome b n=1 Tax=Pasteurella sp. PK-2025 TaxID=3413133 RepID=UPI003C76EC94